MKKNTFLLTVVSILVFAESYSQGILKKHSLEIQKIVKTDLVGVVRGFDFGVTMDKVKATEDAKLEFESKDALMYKVAINEKEYCEVIYTFDASKKLISFGLEFIETKDATPEEMLVDDFQGYFTERYGQFKVNDRDDEVWTSKDGTYVIELSDETTPEVIEIEIEITKK